MPLNLKNCSRTCVVLTNGTEYVFDGEPTDFPSRLMYLFSIDTAPPLVYLSLYDGKQVVVNLNHVVTVKEAEGHYGLYPPRKKHSTD